jgi:hypothetical protein
MPFDHQIKAVALLGATTPARGLGLLTLQRTNARYRYSADHRAGVLYTPNPTRRTSKVDEQKIVQAVISALEQTEVWRWAKQQIAEAEAGDGLGGEDFDGGYTDEFPEDQDDDQDYVEEDDLPEEFDLGDRAAFADDQEEPVRMGGARRYARPRDNRDDDPCWADDCDPQYAAAARGRPAYRPKLLSNLARFPKRGRVESATWSDERDSPSVPVETIAPSWVRSSASPWAERRADGSFSMKGAVEACYADPAQTAAVAKAAEEQFRRWQNRRLEGLA